jgi:sulfotransferase
VYNLYYKDWPQQIIIDRGPVTLTGNPGNFELMKKHFKYEFKCIVLLRDLTDVLASYMKWYKENPDSFVNKLGTTDEEKLSSLMIEDGAIVKEIRAIKNAFKYPKMCHFIKYDDMVANPKKTFIQLYKFLGEPYYPHQFQDLKQININDIEYDDTVLGKNMHKIRTVVKKQINNYVVPESIKRKYEHIKI